MIATDPLTPAMQPQLVLRVMPRQLGIANKPQMGLEAHGGLRLGQAGDPTGNAPGPGIGVRSFKGKHVKLHGDLLKGKWESKVPRAMHHRIALLRGRFYRWASHFLAM